MLISSFILGCSPRITKEDSARLLLLQNRHKSKYSFKVAEGTLIVTQNFEFVIDEEDIKDIYEEYFFDEENKLRTDTNLIYLNLFDMNKKFLYQIYYVDRLKKFEKSNQPYY